MTIVFIGTYLSHPSLMKRILTAEVDLTLTHSLQSAHLRHSYIP